MEEKNIWDILGDENNTENIILYDEENNPVEFEQIAIIPLDEKLYVILKPLVLMEGMSEDDALVFNVTEDETFEIELDDEIIDKVFDIYYEMLEDDSDDGED